MPPIRTPGRTCDEVSTRRVGALVTAPVSGGITEHTPGGTGRTWHRFPGRGLFWTFSTVQSGAS